MNLMYNKIALLTENLSVYLIEQNILLILGDLKVFLHRPKKITLFFM